jgi:hypothetical protein
MLIFCLDEVLSFEKNYFTHTVDNVALSKISLVNRNKNHDQSIGKYPAKNRLPSIVYERNFFRITSWTTLKKQSLMIIFLSI